MSTTSSPGGSRLDPEPVPRRDFLGIASMGAAGSALALAAAGMVRLPNAAVVSSPTKKFQVTLPESLLPGQPYFPPGRQVAVFRDSSGVWAISTICTHLGCLVRSTPEGFDCPCHGTYFTADGAVIRGPAPRPLPWFKVTGSGNTYVVDEGETVPLGTKV